VRGSGTCRNVWRNSRIGVDKSQGGPPAAPVKRYDIKTYGEKVFLFFCYFHWIPLDKCADIYYNGGKLNDTTSTKELSWNTSGTKTIPSQSTLPRASIRPNNSNTSQTPINSLCVTCVCLLAKGVPPLVRHRITHFKENENENRFRHKH
jgi:hypothetical protein